MTGFRRLRWLAVAALTATTACTLGDTCTLIGCESGLNIHLTSVPQDGYTIEVFTDYVDSSPVYTFVCKPGVNCYQEVLMPGLMVNSANIRVTTARGAKVTSVTGIAYRPRYANGTHCGITCMTATVVVQVPE